MSSAGTLHPVYPDHWSIGVGSPCCKGWSPWCPVSFPLNLHESKHIHHHKLYRVCYIGFSKNSNPRDFFPFKFLVINRHQELWRAPYFYVYIAPPHHALLVTASMAATKSHTGSANSFLISPQGFSPHGDNMRQRGPPSLLQWPPITSRNHPNDSKRPIWSSAPINKKAQKYHTSQ